MIGFHGQVFKAGPMAYYDINSNYGVDQVE